MFKHQANFDIELTDDNHDDAWNPDITIAGRKQTRAITLLTSTPIQVNSDASAVKIR